MGKQQTCRPFAEFILTEANGLRAGSKGRRYNAASKSQGVTQTSSIDVRATGAGCFQNGCAEGTLDCGGSTPPF